MSKPEVIEQISEELSKIEVAFLAYENIMTIDSSTPWTSGIMTAGQSILGASKQKILELLDVV